jgi:hypothetical protein
VKAAISLAGVVDLQRAYELHLSNDAVVEFLGGSPAEVGDHYREADPMKLEISVTLPPSVRGKRMCGWWRLPGRDILRLLIRGRGPGQMWREW